MFFQQLLDPDLGCACYVLGDAGEAVVVDPGLDVDRILAAVSSEKARVTHVLETHVHADHVSGRAELCDRTGATALIPKGGDAEGSMIAAGDTVSVRDVHLEAVAAPGHRPEHLAYLVTDGARSDEPCGLLAGDSILVGDLARPDLAVDPVDGARALHATVARLLAYGDGLELWPGHTGGSLCAGPGLSKRPSSTLGYERRAQPLLREHDEKIFTGRFARNLPTRPPTVEAVVARNRTARPGGAPAQRLDLGGFLDCVGRGATVVDGRAGDDFDAGHMPGALNLPLAGAAGLGTRAAFLTPSEAELVVVAADTDDAAELARRLRAVGLRVAGYLGQDVLASAPLTMTSAPSLPIDDLPGRLGEFIVIDVRDDAEWDDGHLDGAIHVPLSRLREVASTIPRRPLAVICAAGPRATAAASFLRRAGHDARRVTGGGVKDLLVPSA